MEELPSSPASENPVDNLTSLFSIVNRLEREAESLGEQIRVVFLRNIAIEGIDPFLKYYLYASGIRPEITFGGYGTLVQDVLAEDGPVARIDPDVIVVTLMLEELDPAFGSPGWRCDSAHNQLQVLFDLLASKTRATIAVNTFLLPLYPELGLALPPERSDLAAGVTRLNDFIVQYVREQASRFCLTDWNRYLRLTGSESGLDFRYWYLSRAPFKKSFLNLYAQELSRIIRALKGRAKKCLILDCDNTLWGGVIGEDGIDNIKLDRNTYPGKAYHDFQTNVLHLAERGVLIALCSKNNESDVLDVLDNHPWCRIKRSHLSAWRIDWQDKATNITALADELNLGLDSLVLVDDNPAECELIRQTLPQVTVLQVPAKLYTYPTLILKDGLFDTLRITAEDKMRATLYQSDLLRRGARSRSVSLDTYLASLETVAIIHEARPNEVSRAAQLTQKTNQFNLTTRRYTEHDIGVFAESPDSAVFTLTVKDKFGALGLVGVLILKREERIAVVDTFLLSCRVLGRGLDSAVVAHCFATIEATWNIDSWKAEYIPTLKNAQVADFWAANGFAEIGDSGGHKTYHLAARAKPWNVPRYLSIRQD